ncbi:hypothetical protein HCH_01337 [Hahella chejuensis KCTC 2396]|uniref:Uncharacterized protein n=1 Tax=Hahella chejuensis (strain KCTC 2396) TaxID=349521 RepID=Q2SMC0_HAHCH|nr:hypothetical protein HCH_01337 [Hahella chejuensis KCTC 2396]
MSYSQVMKKRNVVLTGIGDSNVRMEPYMHAYKPSELGETISINQTQKGA